MTSVSQQKILELIYSVVCNWSMEFTVPMSEVALDTLVNRIALLSTPSLEEELGLK